MRFFNENYEAKKAELDEMVTSEHIAASLNEGQVQAITVLESLLDSSKIFLESDNSDSALVLESKSHSGVFSTVAMAMVEAHDQIIEEATGEHDEPDADNAGGPSDEDEDNKEEKEEVKESVLTEESEEDKEDEEDEDEEEEMEDDEKKKVQEALIDFIYAAEYVVSSDLEGQKFLFAEGSSQFADIKNSLLERYLGLSESEDALNAFDVILNSFDTSMVESLGFGIVEDQADYLKAQDAITSQVKKEGKLASELVDKPKERINRTVAQRQELHKEKLANAKTQKERESHTKILGDLEKRAAAQAAFKAHNAKRQHILASGGKDIGAYTGAGTKKGAEAVGKGAGSAIAQFVKEHPKALGIAGGAAALAGGTALAIRHFRKKAAAKRKQALLKASNESAIQRANLLVEKKNSFLTEKDIDLRKMGQAAKEKAKKIGGGIKAFAKGAINPEVVNKKAEAAASAVSKASEKAGKLAKEYGELPSSLVAAGKEGLLKGGMLRKKHFLGVETGNLAPSKTLKGILKTIKSGGEKAIAAKAYLDSMKAKKEEQPEYQSGKKKAAADIRKMQNEGLVGDIRRKIFLHGIKKDIRKAKESGQDLADKMGAGKTVAQDLGKEAFGIEPNEKARKDKAEAQGYEAHLKHAAKMGETRKKKINRIANIKAKYGLQ